MKYTITDTEINPTGTSLQGYITTTYDNLVEKFGEPVYKAERDGFSDKVWTEFQLEFEDEEGYIIKATIYDWKEEGPGTARNGEYRWHIGGNTYDAVEAVTDYAG